MALHNIQISTVRIGEFRSAESNPTFLYDNSYKQGPRSAQHASSRRQETSRFIIGLVKYWFQFWALRLLQFFILGGHINWF